MKYHPIWKLEHCRITNTYEVEGRTYEAELIPESPGFCAGMAGYGIYCITVLVSEEERQVLNLSMVFPKGRNPHQLMASEATEKPGDTENVSYHGKIEHLSPFAEETIEKAIRFYLCKDRANAPKGMKLSRYTLNVAR